MNVEVIGRQYQVSAGLRRFVESDISKLQGILGDHYKSKVILTGEKARRRAEITVTVPRKRPMVGLGVADGDMRTAIGQALDRIERQALKHNGRRDCRREVKAEWKRELPPTGEELEAAPVVRPRPAAPHPVEPLVQAHNAVVAQPMTIEEAAKFCEEQDMDILVFYDKSRTTRIVHRNRTGRLELVELP